MSLDIIDLLASRFVYDRDMPMAAAGAEEGEEGGGAAAGTAECAIMRKIRQLWGQCA